MGLTLEASPVESPSVATGPKRAFGIREGWLDSFIFGFENVLDY